MAKPQSTTGIVYATVDVKAWLARLPSVEEVRPGRCPHCGGAGRPAGARLGLWGHGLKQRQQRGPLAPDGPPATITIAVRRYLCQTCAAVVLVVPRGVEPRRHYAGPVIAWALALFGLEHRSAAEVRRRASPWRVVGATAAAGWACLRRWIRAVRAGRLFGPWRFTAEGPARAVAATVAARLAASAPPTLRTASLPTQAFAGAAQPR